MRALVLATLLLGFVPALSSASPMGLAWDDAGWLWVSDTQGGGIYRVDPTTGIAVAAFTPFADVYAANPPANNRIRDLAWDGTRIWAAYWTDPMRVLTDPGDINGGLSKIYAFDPSSGAIVDSIVAPFVGRADGLEWDGAALWVGEEDGKVYRIDPGTEAVLGTLTVPTPFGMTANPRGLAWDGSGLWTGYQAIDHDQLKRFALDGTLLKELDSPCLAFQLGLAFDGAYLWATGCGKTLWQIDPTTGNVVKQLTFDASRIVSEPGVLVLLGLCLGMLGAIGRTAQRGSRRTANLA